MGKTDWTTIIIGGGALVAGVYAWINWKTVCPQVFGADSTACAGDTPLAAIEGVFTSAQRYMSDKAPATSVINTNPNASKNAAAAIKAQQDFSNPKTKAASQTYLNVAKNNAGTSAGGTSGANGTGYNCNSTLCKLYPSNCPGCAKSNYTSFNSFNTITLNRMSVR
jgi:hypothetical protein